MDSVPHVEHLPRIARSSAGHAAVEVSGQPMTHPARRLHDVDREPVVARVQRAYADGRLGFAEMEERLERALTAVTQAELAWAVADLPEPPDEVVRLRSANGRVRRTGDWQVPRVLQIESEYGGAILDLSQAVIAHSEIEIDLQLAYGSATIVLPPGATANVDGMQTEWGRVICKTAGRPRPGSLHVQITGKLGYGRLKVRSTRRPARRAFATQS
ncbi:DUF1707 SHOCT-like domain-containing protein [Nonomuraea guangzhouensis]|uniref:DUF1707 domain-containing protein n=1 Tax=Nonomuraea guangzhouensis TaxID=1291555 RepID=A0ABW4GEC9_9ACTN|nr:DUF1707 domain-containing protein [Nonomuraea guangzhouensis]